MSKQRLGERFSGTRYIAVIKADGATGVSLVHHWETPAIWDAANEADWPWINGMKNGVLIRLKLTEHEDVVLDGCCEITLDDIVEIENEMLEDSDE